MRILKYVILCIISMLGGVFFLALQQQWLIIHVVAPYRVTNFNSSGDFAVRHINYTYHKHDEQRFHQQEIIWDSDIQLCALRLISSYWELLEDEKIITSRVTVDTACFNDQKNELIVSFSHNPFNDQQTVAARMTIIEDLLMNVRSHFPQLKQVRFLMRHEPLIDNLLEFSFSWPITGFHAAGDSPQHTTQPVLPEKCLIILNPAGNVHNPGRIIGESFERTLTLQFAQAVKRAVEKLLPKARVLITSTPGEVISQFHMASYVNNLDAHLYLHIGMYHTSSQIPDISFYTMAVDPAMDMWTYQDTDHFVPFYFAHRRKIQQSRELLGILHAYATTYRPIPFQVHDVRSIPYKSLVGVTIPAIALEIGLPNHAAWQLCVEPLAHMLCSCITRGADTSNLTSS
jgi:hypothetical protein